jgi:hypothetical protein
MKLSIGAGRASFAIVGSAIVFTIYYIVLGFPKIDRTKFGSRASRLEARKSAHALKVAKQACKLAPRESVVLAPKRVSQHLFGLADCAGPFFVDMESSNTRVSEKLKRHAMVRYVEFMGDLPFSETHQFVEDLRRHRIRVVVMSQEGLRNPRVKQILRQSSYHKVEVVEKYHIWIQREHWREVKERHRREAERLCRRVSKESYALVPYAVADELDKLGCCRSFLNHPPAAFANSRFDKQRGLLENALSSDNDPTPAELKVLNEVLQSQLIRGIVLVQDGDGSRKLKDALRRHNFKLATRHDYYRLWIPKDDSAN